MKKLITEGRNILSVTTLFPLGWGLSKLAPNNSQVAPMALLQEHENPVMLVHGIFHNSTAFFELERTLRKARFNQLSSINLWTSLNRMEDLAQQLRVEAYEFLTAAEQQRRFSNRKLKLRIVAHSLGGMITRVALLDSHFASLIDKVVFLGTPHQGAGMLRLPFPSCLKDLKRGSDLVKRLNSEPLASGPRYYNFRGQMDFVTPLTSTFLPHVHNIEFNDVGHAGLLNDRRVLNSVVEILESPFYDQSVG